MPKCIRKRKHSLMSLAISALVLQVCVLAGHFHDEDLSAVHDHASCSTEPSSEGSQGCPSHDERDGCDMCWAVVATGTAAIATQSIVDVPAFEGHVIRSRSLRTLAPQIACAAFQPRGPPSTVCA